MPTDPEVSVIIPTHNREARLAIALEALARQTLAPERFEVVVVRSPDTAAPFADAPDGLRVRFLTHAGRPGPGAQRNSGLRVARGALVAFTDDDCRPSAAWLERLLERAGSPIRLIQGRTEPDPDESHLQVGLIRTQYHLRASEWFETCNIAYPRAMLEWLGGFDEDFEQSAEDVDLGLRATEAGAGRAFAPDAVVYHAVLPDTLPRALRGVLARDATPLLISRHPRHRRRLFLRLFWKPSHAKLLLALAGVLSARRHPLLGALATLPYLDRYVDWRQAARPRGLARIAVFLGARVAIDAVEVIVTARGAIRHRVLVL